MFPKEFKGMEIVIIGHGDGLFFANAYKKGEWKGAWKISREEARLMCLRRQANLV